MKFMPTSKNAYQELMVVIYTLMNKGESNLKAAECRKLAQMSAAAEKYEDEILLKKVLTEDKNLLKRLAK